MAEPRLPWWRKALQKAIDGLRSGLGRLMSLGGELLAGDAAGETLSVVPTGAFEPLQKSEDQALAGSKPGLPRTDAVVAAEETVVPVDEAAEVEASSESVIEASCAPEMVQMVTAVAQPKTPETTAVAAEVLPAAVEESVEAEAPAELLAAVADLQEAEVDEEVAVEPVIQCVVAPEMVQTVAATAEPVLPTVTVEVAAEVVAEPEIEAEPEVAVEEPRLETEIACALEPEPAEENVAAEAEPVAIEAEPEVLEVAEVEDVAVEAVAVEAEGKPAEEVEAELAAEADPVIELAEELPLVEESRAEPVAEIVPEAEPLADPAAVEAVCSALEKQLAEEPAEVIAVVPEAIAASASLGAEEEPVDEGFADASAQVLTAPAFIAYFAVPSREAGAEEPVVPVEDSAPQVAPETELTEELVEESLPESSEAEPVAVASEAAVEEVPPSRAEPLEPSGCDELAEGAEAPVELAATELVEACVEPASEPAATDDSFEKEEIVMNEPVAEMEVSPQVVEIERETVVEAEGEALVEVVAVREEPAVEAGSAPADAVEAVQVEERREEELVDGPAALQAEEVILVESEAVVDSAAPVEPTSAAAADEAEVAEEAVDEAASPIAPEAEATPAALSNLLQMPSPVAEVAADPAALLAPVKAMIRRESDDATAFSILVDKVYDGPLDLLLDLIRKQDIDVYDIPIAKITGQFLAYVERLKATDMDSAGEFIYMASLLIHIKSKMLLPRAPSGPDDAADDPRRELVERLLEHERFKNAAQMLQEKQMVEAASWSNPGAKEFKNEETGEVEIAADTTDLVRIFQKILERARKRPVFNVNEDQVTVGQMLQYLSRRLTMEDKPVALRRVLSHTKSERALICMFLALLELVRLQAVLLRQDSAFSEIFIKKHTGFDAVIGEALANARDDWQ